MAKKKVELRGGITPDGTYDVSAWVDGQEASDPDLILRGVGAGGVVALYERVKDRFGQEPEIPPGDLYDCFPEGFFEE